MLDVNVIRILMELVSPDLDAKWVKLTISGTNPGIFFSQIQYILLGEPKCTAFDMKKNREFIPFWVILTPIWA